MDIWTEGKYRYVTSFVPWNGRCLLSSRCRKNGSRNSKIFIKRCFLLRKQILCAVYVLALKRNHGEWHKFKEIHRSCWSGCGQWANEDVYQDNTILGKSVKGKNTCKCWREKRGDFLMIIINSYMHKQQTKSPKYGFKILPVELQYVSVSWNSIFSFSKVSIGMHTTCHYYIKPTYFPRVTGTMFAQSSSFSNLSFNLFKALKAHTLSIVHNSRSSKSHR